MPIGLQAHVGIAKETVWGTPVAAARYVPFINQALAFTTEHVGSDNVIGFGNSQQQSPIEGAHTNAGDITFQARPTILGDFLRMMLNAPATVTLTAGQSFKHTFKPRNTFFAAEAWGLPYTFETYEAVSATQSRQFAGVVASSLELRIGSRDKFMVGAASLIGRKKPILITKTAPTIEARNPFTWQQAAWTLPDPTAYRSFSQIAISMAWTLRGEHVMDQTREIALLQPDALLSVAVTGTTFPMTIDEYNEFSSQSERVLKLVCDTGVNIGASTDKYKLTVTIPKFRYRSYDIPVSGVGLVAAEVAGAGFYDATELSAITFDLQNELSAY